MLQLYVFLNPENNRPPTLLPGPRLGEWKATPIPAWPLAENSGL